MKHPNHKQFVDFILGCSFLIASIGAHANSELENLLQILKANGTITEEEYQRLLSESKEEQGARVEVDDGFKVKSADGDFAFELGGEFWFDVAYYQEDKVPLGDGTKLRRSRISLEGKVFD